MNGVPYSPNAIWWVQWRLLGGPGKLIPFCTVYLTLLVSAAIGVRYLDRSIPLAAYCDRAILVLAMIQTLLLVPGGCNAVFRALRRDIESKMLESHRLTPLSSAAVMIGYTVGANLQVLMMYGIGVVVGSVIIRWGTVGAADWLLGNLLMLLVAPMTWTATLALNVGRDKPLNPATLMFVGLILWAPLLFLPGAGLLSGAYAGYIATTMMAGQNSVPAALAAVPIVVVIALALTWARAAMRKYRRPDRPAFGVVRGLGLFIIWLGAGSFGLWLARIVASRDIAGMGANASPWNDAYFASTCLISTAGVAMLVALFPLTASTMTRVRLRRGVAPSDYIERSTASGIPFLCTALVLAFLVPHLEIVNWWFLAITFVSVWASFLVLEGLLLRFYTRNRKAGRWIAVYVIFFFGVPPLVDLWYGEWAAATSAEYLASPQQTALFGFSPLGTLARMFMDELTFDPLPGVIFQAAMGSIAWVVGWRALHRVRRQ